ncbi:RING-type domain containing protein [Lactarius tabidus]
MSRERRAPPPDLFDRIPADSPLRDLILSLVPTDSDDDELPGLTDDEIQSIVEKLPRLTESDLENLGHDDSSCSICMNTFRASLAEEEMAQAMESPAQPAEELGVTRLIDTCGHVFCRKDLLLWIRDRNASCPLCRTLFIEQPSRNESQRQRQRRVPAAYGNVAVDSGEFSGMYS